jgi:hypothetical protein
MVSPSSAQCVLELPDLFAPHLRRERVVDWQAPGPAAKAAMGMSGMEAMCAIRDGILPPPPLAKLIGFRMSSVEPGRIVMELDADQLYRRLCSRRRRQSRNARNFDLFHDRRCAKGEIAAAFSHRGCYYMTINM